MTYSLKDVNTTEVATVKASICRILSSFHGPGVEKYVHELMDTMESMFAGEYKTYGRVTTEYHNREHTLQATLCFVRLLEGLYLSGDEPKLGPDACRVGLAAVLLHDVGYLQDREDSDGTGARYTIEHEERGCRMAAEYLEEIGWSREDIEWVTTIIRCTGPRSQVNRIDFVNDAQRFLARAVCTADYLGQMADYRYLEKLPVLFAEFQESDDYLQIPAEKRMFHSSADLISKTPGFWEFVKQKVLTQDCGEVYKYLARPPGSDNNPYFRKIDRNMAKIKAMVDNGNVEAFIKDLQASI